MASEPSATDQNKQYNFKVHQRHRSNSDPETTAQALAQLKIEESKKSNGTMRSGSLGTHRHSTTPPPVRKSRFAALGKLFKPWKWKRKKKSDKFEQTSRALERKISVRATREELIKKGVLLPESQSNLSSVSEDSNDMSMSTTSLPNGNITSNGGLSDNAMMSYSSPFLMGTEIIDNNNTESPITDYQQLHDKDRANGFTSFSCSIPTSQSGSQIQSQHSELTLSALPDPPIAVTEIGPIPPPPMFSCPSPVMLSSNNSQNVTKTTQSFTNSTVPSVSISSQVKNESDDEDDETEVQQQSISYHSDESSESEDSPAKQLELLAQNNPSIDQSLFDVIPVKEPSLSSIPRKSALKKKVDLLNLAHLPNATSSSPVPPPRQDSNVAGNRNFRIPVVPNEAPSPPPRICPRICPRVTRFDVSNKENVFPVNHRIQMNDDSDSEDEPLTEQSRLASKIARRDSLALKLAQRPNIQELIDKHILITQSDNERQRTREAVGIRLIRRLSQRPSAEELEQRNILKQQTPEEFRKEKEQKKRLLLRKLSFRPTVEELKERKIIRFNDYIEVTSAHDYDRKADKPWTRLTPRDKAAIRKELNEFKSMEMDVHEDSRHLTRFHRP